MEADGPVVGVQNQTPVFLLLGQIVKSFGDHPNAVVSVAVEFAVLACTGYLIGVFIVFDGLQKSQYWKIDKSVFDYVCSERHW